MKNTTEITFILTLALLSTTLNAQSEQRGSHHGHHSQYAGQQNRTIKSFSEQDIITLKNGGGWGFAKAAELNGFPGPAHVLELKDKLKLSEEQLKQTEKLHSRMKQEAIQLGKEYIALEKKLDEGFRNKTIDKPAMQKLLTKIATVRSQLRYTHLQTHLDMTTILNRHQIMKYNHLRGYNRQILEKTQH